MGKGNRNKSKRKLEQAASADVVDTNAGKDSKKNKTDDVLSVISPSLLSEKSRNKLKWFHDHSEPYRHLVLSPLCNRDHMVKVHEEVVQNLNGNLKETDLYKLFQTTEMSRIKSGVGDNDALLGHLLKLRTAIYSKDFRDFVQDITGCGELTDRTDLSCNAYANGCHLLCHDDVIGTRCISFIIYVTDPSSEWTAEDGGGLELYPLDDSAPQKNGQGIPTSIPTKIVLPKFNTMAMFVVQPGKSYHAVQEVFTADKPRISISGWYHTKEPPVGSDNASLSQILKKGDDLRLFTPLKPYANKPSVAAVPTIISDKKKDKKNKKDTPKKKKSKDEEEETVRASASAALESDPAALAYLKCFINPIYLEPSSLEDINKEFVRDSSIQLGSFLLEHIADKIKELGKNQDKFDELGNCKPPMIYDIGVKEVCNSAAKDGSDGEGAEAEAAVLKRNLKKFKKSNKSVNGTDWVLTGPPHKRRYLHYPLEDSDEGFDCTAVTAESVEKYVSSVRSLGELLSFINRQVFQCNIFTSFLLPLMTELDTIHGYRNEIRRFRPGLDYTVAHFGLMTAEPKLDCTLCFAYDSEEEEEEEEEEEDKEEEEEVGEEESESRSSSGDMHSDSDDNSDDGSDSESDSGSVSDDNSEDDCDELVTEEDRSWEGGDVGGFECYIAAEDDAANIEASEVYQIQSTDANSGGADLTIDADGSQITAQKKSAKNASGEANESELLSISAGDNVLSIVMRDQKVMKFVKYLNSRAPSSRWDITAEYEL